MKINDIKLTVDKPTRIKLLLLRDQDIEKEMSIGRIVDGKVQNSNITPLWLTKDLAIIREVWLTPDIGLYVSFSESIEVSPTEESDGISMTSHDAKGLLSSEKISWSVE